MLPGYGSQWANGIPMPIQPVVQKRQAVLSRKFYPNKDPNLFRQWQQNHLERSTVGKQYPILVYTTR